MDLKSISGLFLNAFFTASIFLTILFCGTNCKALASVNIAADNPSIQYFGRFDFSNPKSPTFDWPGTSIQFRFTGPSCAIYLSGGTNDFNVFIDGVLKSHLVLENAKSLYDLAVGLADTEHTLLLTKRTEASYGNTTFSGFQLAEGQSAILPLTRTAKKIQFIGDSWTVGYGNEASSVTCEDRRAFDNNYLAFGPVLARALDAEYSVQAGSGRGMVHNYGDTIPLSSEPMPKLFDRTLANSAALKWNFASWIPDIVVIALGINDFSGTVKPSQIQYTSAYEDFIKKIHGYFPNAVVICVAFQRDTFQGNYIGAMVANLIANGDSLVHSVTMPALVLSELGCGYHPNVAAHKKFADFLLPVVNLYLGAATGLPHPKTNSKNKQTRSHFHENTPRFPVQNSGNTSDSRGRIN